MSDQSKSSEGPASDADAGPTNPSPPPVDEFAGIPSPPRRRSWMALAVVLGAGYLIVHQRSDVVYALSPSAPMLLGDARALASRPTEDLPVNRLVRIEGVPDFESGLILDTQGQWQFRQMFRLLGTGTRFLVQRAPDPLPVSMAERMAFSGRLVPLSGLGFDESIRAHYAQHVGATDFFALEDLQAGVAAAHVPLQVANTAGDKVSLAGNQRLTVVLDHPGMFVVTVPRTDMLRAPETARDALVAAGTRVVSGPRLVQDRTEAQAFDVEIPLEKEAAILSALADISPGIRIRRALDEYSVGVGSLRIEGEHLIGMGRPRAPTGPDKAAPATPPADIMVTLTPALVRDLRTSSTLELPENALLLIEGERPARHYRSVVAAVFLAVFAGLNLVALIKGV